MKTLIALVVLAALLLGSFFLFQETRESSPLEGPGLIQPDSPSGDGGESLEVEGKKDGPGIQRKNLPGPGETGGKDPVDEAYQAALTGLRGRVLWESSRKPVTGVKVEAFELGSGFTTQDWNGSFPGFLSAFEPKAVTRTDEEGRFFLKGFEPNEFLLLLIGAGTDKSAFRLVDRSARPGETAELDDILLKDRGSLEGVVLGPDEKPIRGAKVYALDIPRMAFDFGLSGYDPEGLLVNPGPYRSFAIQFPPLFKKLEKKLPFGIAWTGTDGSFRIKGLRKGQTSVLIVAPDLERTHKSTLIRPGKTRDLGRIVLKEGGRIHGKVLNGEAQPIEGALVSVAPAVAIPIGFGRKPKRTDAKGLFEFGGLGRGKHYVLLKVAEDIPWQVFGPFRPGDEIELRQTTLLSRKILVQSKGGKPLMKPSFKLAVDLGGGPPPELLPVGLEPGKHLRKTGVPGTWVLHNLPKGVYSLQVSAKGFAPTKVQVELSKKQTAPVICRLLPGVSIQVFAQDRSGKPLPSARVYYRGERTRGTILLGRTRKDGTLDVPLVPLAKGTLIARHPRYAFGLTPLPLPVNGASYRIILPNPGRIEGRIFNSTSQEKKVYTILVEPSWKTRRPFGDLLPPRFTVSEPNGRFSLGGLQPGEYRIMPFVDIGKLESINRAFQLQSKFFLYSRKRISAFVPEGGTVQVSLDLGPKPTEKGTGSISGIVRIDGKTQVGMALALWGKTSRRTVTNAAGRYQFSGLPKSIFQVSLMKKDKETGLHPLSSQSVRLKDGEQKTLDFDIQMGTLVLQLLDPKGHPLDSTPVYLKPVGNVSSFITAYTDDKGRLRKRIPFGKWQINLGWTERKQAGFSLPRDLVEIRSATPVHVTIKGREDLRVQGTIRLDFSKVHPDWMDFVKKNPPKVAYIYGMGSSWGVPLNPDGSPSPLGEGKRPMGTYSATAFNKIPWMGKVEITPENHLSLRIVLEPPKVYTLPKKKPGNSVKGRTNRK